MDTLMKETWRIWLWVATEEVPIVIDRNALKVKLVSL